MTGADVSFVHLGISIPHMVKSFSIGGISFAYYGLIIGIGMILGLCVAQSDANAGDRIQIFTLISHFTELSFPSLERGSTMFSSSGPTTRTT